MHDYSKPCGEKKLRFREWLVKKLDEKQIPGVEWIDRTQGIFKIPWKHASRHNWSVSDDSEIFKQWAIYSGKYRDGEDKPNPSKWKTNFRCTLNALPYFKEITDRSCPRGPVAYRIYLLMPSTLKAVDKKSSKGREHSEATETLDLSDREIIQMVDEMIMKNSVVSQKPLPTSPPKSAFPAFETLIAERSRLFSLSPLSWHLSAWNAMAVDQFSGDAKGDISDDSAGDPASEATSASSSSEVIEMTVE
ncbi:interferon regulatory factor 1-like [Montipora capricornis]|uniref:interferon regulatory factor 1-like n=1 Tax=Montipora capricornis TaxID=246305 RepID=UPI0035F1EB01